jgi:hypothetical protein
MDWLSTWPDLATYRGLNLAVLRGFSASGSGLETGEFSQGSYESMTGVTVVGVRGHLVAIEASAEDTAILQSLMNAGSPDRMEFMG